MGSQDLAALIDNVTRLCRARMQFFDHRGVIAIWHETNILAVGFIGHAKPVFARQSARFCLGCQMPQGKSQVVELLSGGREQKVTLIAIMICGHMQLRTIRTGFALDVMACGHAICIKIFGRLQQVFEFHPLIAANARHGRGPSKVAFSEIVDNRFAKRVFIVQYIMRKIELFGHAARIMYVTASTAGAFFCECGSVIVKLQGNANNIIALRR